MRRPKVLIVGLHGKYLGTARLPASLKKAGADVTIVCVERSYLAATRHADRIVVLPQKHVWWRPHGNLLQTLRLIATGDFDLLIPMDEASMYDLHGLRSRLGSMLPLMPAKAKKSIGRSLPAKFSVAVSRWSNQRLAQELGIRCPAAGRAASLQELRSFTGLRGFPVVLKAEGTTAGNGVRICRTEADAEMAWNELRATKGGKTIVVQSYIDGVPAMRAICALEGQVLDGISAIKAECNPAPTGPSSTIHITHCEEMVTAAQKLAAALGLSGFAGLDLMIEHGTGNAYWIELNPRPTPICHLGSLSSRLVEALGGESCSAADMPEGLKIALYPQEWLRRGAEVEAADLLLDKLVDDPQLFAMYEEAWRAAAGRGQVAP